MKIFLTAIMYMSAVFGSWLFLCSALNAVRFLKINRRAKRYALKHNPLVSVIIPARNEERNLGVLLQSMLDQEYRNIEILVIDDRSTDRTWEIIEEFEKKDSRVKGYKTGEKRYTTHGKMNALLNLIPHAKGEYLLCTDADTTHRPGSVLNALKIMERDSLDILSGFPAEYSRSYFARTITASMVFSNVCIPHFIFNALRVSSFAIGIGQFIMMRRDSYDEVGGYAVLGDQICDDLGIIKAFLKKKKKYEFTVLSDNVCCRMYDTGKEAFRGIERSLAGVFTPSLWMFSLLILAVIFLSLVSFAPVLAPLYVIWGEYTMMWIMLAGWLMTNISWFFACRRLHFRISTSLSGSISIVLICVMYLHCVYTRLRGRKFIWKGEAV